MTDNTRIAVIGCGLAGRRHVEAIQHAPDAQLAAIVDPDDSALSLAADLAVPCFNRLDDLFDDGMVDGAIVATPTPLHVRHGLACIEHGCPVLVEKPIAVTCNEAQSLIAASRKQGVALLVGHHRRYNDIVQTARAAIDGGMIGRLRAVQATCWLYKPASYFTTAPWRTRRNLGPVSVNLVHDVDLLRHFCGEVVRVQAQSVPAIRGFENEDLAAAILSFRSGVVATVSVADAIAAPWSWELTTGENPVYPRTTESCYLMGGSHGSLSIPDLRVWSHKGNPDWWSPIEQRSLKTRSADPLVLQVSHFAKVIRGRESPLVPGIEGLRSLQVVEAVQVAARTGKTLDITPLGQPLPPD